VRGRARALLLTAVDASALRDRLDTASTAVARQGRPVARVCARVLPFVTPGLAVTVDGTDDAGDGTFSVETESTRPLTIRGRAGGAHGGHVTVVRDGRRLAVVPIGPDGRFSTRPLRLRHVADSSFAVAIAAPRRHRAPCSSARSASTASPGPGRALVAGVPARHHGAR
jgi:hypothetical protein